jgi:Family of unknown function (DUF6152)
MNPRSVCLVVSSILAALPLAAQSPFAASYDVARHVTLHGAVTRIDWVNPQAFFFVDVRKGNGSMTNWAVEFGNPLELERNGWSRTSLHIGDVVTVEGIPAVGGHKVAFAKSVVLTAGNRKIFTTPAKLRAVASGREAAPRWPDGQIRLGPPPGKEGYWATTTSALVEAGGAPISMDADGLLAHISDAARVAPFQPWAKALYEYRQRTRLKDDPLARCIPPGGPRQFQTANGFQFVEQRELGRILVLLGGGDRNWHVIYTDGRKQGEPDEVVRSYYGNSVGHWEGDTLVVDSIGFNEHFWFAKGGLPHTEGLHLIERFTRSDLNTLKYEVTVDDPRTYTRPWKGGWTMEWVPDRELQEYFCEENAESTFVR